VWVQGGGGSGAGAGDGLLAVVLRELMDSHQGEPKKAA